MKGEGKSSRRLTQVDAAGGETSVCVVTGLFYPQGESGAAATEKTRVLRVGCRAGIKIARRGRFVPSSSCYRLKLTGPLRPVHISIPALRTEGDFFEPDGQGQTFIPAFTQRVTGLAVPFVQGQQISTHTLRVEGDCPLPSTTSTRWTSFYPRPPHGGRLFPRGGQALVRHFYPRPHMEGDPCGREKTSKCFDFYPRPHMEGDSYRISSLHDVLDFYPRPHMEGDKRPSVRRTALQIFLPTPSHGGRQRRRQRTYRRRRDFYPRPHMEGDAVI